MKVGFIGLGTMGARMAANLQKAGHQLIVYDVRREAAAPFVNDGAKWADSPHQLATESEVIFTSLPGPVEVDQIALGEGGLLAGMRAGSAYFDLSTNSPDVVRRVNAAFAERGVQMLDAPVSGGPRGAATGKLAIWVGGDKAAFDRFKTVLDSIGDQARYIGPIGSATIAKLVHNCAGYAINRVMSEVFTMGVKAGVDPLTLWEAVRQGALGRMRTFDGLVNQFLPNTYDPPAFALKLAHKDVTLATALGRELHVPMPMASLALDELTAALNRGWGDRDSRSAMLLQQERADVKIAVDAEQLKAAIERDGKTKG